MCNLNLSSAGMRADSSVPFNNQGHCHNRILFLYLLSFPPPPVWLSKGDLELRFFKQTVPFVSVKQLVEVVKAVVAEAHICNKKCMHKTEVLAMILAGHMVMLHSQVLAKS